MNKLCARTEAKQDIEFLICFILVLGDRVGVETYWLLEDYLSRLVGEREAGSLGENQTHYMYVVRAIKGFKGV